MRWFALACVDMRCYHANMSSHTLLRMTYLLIRCFTCQRMRWHVRWHALLPSTIIIHHTFIPFRLRERVPRI